LERHALDFASSLIKPEIASNATLKEQRTISRPFCHEPSFLYILMVL